jgi:hypothetical protein
MHICPVIPRLKYLIKKSKGKGTALLITDEIPSTHMHT